MTSDDSLIELQSTQGLELIPRNSHQKKGVP